MTTPFPLLRLPRLALIPVFQEMDSIDVLVFSLLSKKAHNLSKIFRKLSSRSVHLAVESDHLDVRVGFDLLRKMGLKYYFNTEKIPLLANAMFQKRPFTHKNSGLNASQWLERVLDVTNCKSIDQLDLKGSPQNDMCDTFGKLQKIRKLNIFKNCPNIFAKKSLEILSTVSSEITLFKMPFETRDEFQTFLKSNLNYLNINTNTFPNFKFTLEDLMVTNALILNLNDGKLNLEEINQFFQNWMENKCNPRLEHLEICTFENVDEKNLLNGLKPVSLSRNRQRAFHIRRADRKKATITFENIGGMWFISFYV